MPTGWLEKVRACGESVTAGAAAKKSAMFAALAEAPGYVVNPSPCIISFNTFSW